MFLNRGYAVLNEEFQTLVKENHWVEANLLNAYVVLLNYKERFKSAGTCSRMFIPIEISVCYYIFYNTNLNNSYCPYQLLAI